MTEKKDKQNLADLVSPNTKREEFVGMVEGSLTPEEKRDLGGDYLNKVVDSMSYLGVFAPAPATYEKNAFLFTGGQDLEEKEVDVVWGFLKRTGLLVDEVKVAPGRVSISEKLVNMLANPSNGFLT